MSILSSTPQGRLFRAGAAFIAAIMVSAAIPLSSQANPIQPTTNSWQNPQLLRTIPGLAHRMGISPNGKIVATVIEPTQNTAANTIKVWNLETGKEIYTLKGHTDYISNLEFSPDNQILASSEYRHPDRMLIIKLWDLKTGKEIRTLRRSVIPKIYSLNGGTFWSNVASIAFSRDGKTLVSAATNPLIQRWDLNQGKLSQTLLGQRESVRALAYSPDGKLIAVGHWNGAISLFDSATSKLIRTLQSSGDALNLDFTSDGRLIAVSDIRKPDSTTVREVRIWNPTTGEVLQTIPGLPGDAWIEFSPDAKTYVTAHHSKGINIFDLQSGAKLHTVPGDAFTVVFSPNGQHLVVNMRDGVKIWR